MRGLGCSKWRSLGFDRSLGFRRGLGLVDVRQSLPSRSFAHGPPAKLSPQVGQFRSGAAFQGSGVLGLRLQGLGFIGLRA